MHVGMGSCQLTPHLPCRSWDWSSGDSAGDIGFLFCCSPLWGQCFFEEFRDCFSLPSFWDKVLNNPGWSRNQKLGPKVIKYWGHRLTTVLGTCVTALFTWAFHSSRRHPEVFLLCVRGDLLSIVSGLHTAGCVQITICQSSPAERHHSQDSFLHTLRSGENAHFFMALLETERNQERLHLQSFPKQSGTGYNCNISET